MNYLKILKRNLKDNLYVFKNKIFWKDFVVDKKNIKFLDINSTIDYLKKNPISFGRIGDGEIYLYLGYDLDFQNYNKFFVEKMEEIFEMKNPNFLLGIPNAIFKREKELPYPEYWRTTKIFLNYKLKRDKIYGDSLITHSSKELETLWNNKKILLVAKQNFINAENFIKIPEKNALDYFEEIKNQILNFNKPYDIVLLSCGPCATIMSYELSKSGILAYDVGHFYEKVKK